MSLSPNQQTQPSYYETHLPKEETKSVEGTPPSNALRQIDQVIRKSTGIALHDLKDYAKVYKRYWAAQMADPDFSDSAVENTGRVFYDLIGMLCFENAPETAKSFKIEGARSRILVQAFTHFIQQVNFCDLLKITKLDPQSKQLLASLQVNIIPLFKKHLSLIAALKALSQFDIPYINEYKGWIGKKIVRRLEKEPHALFPLGSLSKAPLSGHGYYGLSSKGEYFDVLNIINASPSAGDPVQFSHTPDGKPCTNRWEVDCARELIYQNVEDLAANLTEAIQFRLPVETERQMESEIPNYNKLRKQNPAQMSAEVIHHISTRITEILLRNADEDLKFSNREHPLKRFCFTQGISCTMAPLRAILYQQAQAKLSLEEMGDVQEARVKFLIDLIYFKFKHYCYWSYGSKLPPENNLLFMLHAGLRSLSQERIELLMRGQLLGFDHSILQEVTRIQEGPAVVPASVKAAVAPILFQSS